MSDMTPQYDYNELVETAFLNTNRRLRQALTALQACVTRLNEVCDPSEEWWQNVDMFFEDATLKDPRSKTHKFDVSRRIVRSINVVVPHALDIANPLNNELVQRAINRHMATLNTMEDVPLTTLEVAGHTITIEATDSGLEYSDPYVSQEGPW